MPLLPFLRDIGTPADLQSYRQAPCPTAHAFNRAVARQFTPGGPIR